MNRIDGKKTLSFPSIATIVRTQRQRHTNWCEGVEQGVTRGNTMLEPSQKVTNFIRSGQSIEQLN